MGRLEWARRFPQPAAQRENSIYEVRAYSLRLRFVVTVAPDAPDRDRAAVAGARVEISAVHA